MKLFKKTCKNPNCNNDFIGTKTQQFCCPECRPAHRNHKPKKTCTLGEVARKAKTNGMSYGKYVAMQYQAERMRNNE